MNKPAPTIRDLYPHMSDEELKETEANLDEYLMLGLRIFNRVCAEPGGYERLKALTRKNRLKYYK